MHSRFMLFTVIALCLFAFVPHLADAQTPVPTPVNAGREFFTLGGRNDHVFVYPEAQQGLAQGVKDALSASFAVYQPLFGLKSGQTGQTPFQVVVFYQGDPARQEPDVIARGGILPKRSALVLMTDIYPLEPILDESVCFIELFNLYLTDTAHRGGGIAHELTHCYVQHYNPNGFGADKTAVQWWSEGGGDWLASLVYPAEFPMRRHNNFRYDRSTLIRQYTNLHFWAWVAGPEGLGSSQAVVDYFMTMPADITQYPALLEGIKPGTNPIDFHHNWILALFENRVPFQPNMGLAGTIYENASGGSVRLNGVRFAGDHAVINGIKVDPGSRAVVTLSAAREHNYAVSLKLGGRWQRLQDGTQLDFCPEGGKLDVLFSRANAPTEGDRANFVLTFTQDPNPSNPPCIPKTDPTPVPRACITGAWVVAEFPASMLGAEGIKVDTTGYIYEFKADGTYTGVYGIFAQLPDAGGNITVNIPFVGTYNISPMQGSPTIYAVHEFSMTMQPGGSAIVTSRGGDTGDVTSAYYNVFRDTTAFLADGELSCNAQTLEWVSSAGFVFRLSRQP
ncbi:MAG: hypothetical protein IPK52_09850 [Chloroflexi bacterium]|nr:hypothetical protein [Chloroflexota bacterium]